MTVLQLISSEGFYGAENMLVTLANALFRQGHRPVVAVFEDGRRPRLEVARQARLRGIPVELVPCGARWDWRVPGRIRRILKRHGAAVLHTHGYKADVYGYAAARTLRTVIVSTCHNWPDRRPLMRAYAAADRFVLRRFDRVAAASQPVAEVLKRCGVVAAELPNGIDPDRFRQAAPVLRERMPRGCDRLAGFAGRLVTEKGGEVMLRAARDVLAVRPGTAFVFAGEGPCRREWEELAARLGVSRNVWFTGAWDDMPGFYTSLDLLVLPSADEALPMCVLEAMAAGRPVVATRVGSVPRAVLPGVTGLLVAPGDSDGLARAMLDLLENEEMAARLGAQAREHVAKHFSAEKMAAAYLELYERALSGEAGQS